MGDEVIESIKLYCRIDDELDEEVLDLKLSAEEYLKNAGVKINYESNLYFLVIKMLIKHWYDNKGIIANKGIEIPYGITCIINQLQLSNLGDNDAT